MTRAYFFLLMAVFCIFAPYYSAMTLRDLFIAHPDIIINTDIDGILSGVFLSHYCGCKVAGFSNSKDTVWLRDGINSVYDPVYIDMFVPRPDVWCVDQHIVSVNGRHHDRFVAAGTKLSPQLDRHRVFERNDYKSKYPFGAVHYIIARLENEGVKVDLPDLHTVVDARLNIRLGDLLLRADDAMKTSLNSNYVDNAKGWWKWLWALSDHASSVRRMIDFLYKDTPTNKVNAIKANTKAYFFSHFGSSSGDGGFEGVTDSANIILPNVVGYINEMARIMGMPLAFERHYVPHVGQFKRVSWDRRWENEFVDRGTIHGEAVFSYAFVYGPDATSPNFSYTVNMP